MIATTNFDSPLSSSNKMQELNKQLWRAIDSGNTTEVQEIVGLGADPNYIGGDGHTAVDRACMLNYLDILEILLNAGGSLTSVDNDRETPLHLAAREGHTSVVERLLALGADPLQSSDYGTPLDRAAYAGHISVAASLLNAGVPATIKNCWGRTPLHEACRYGHIEVARLLLRQGADVNAIDEYGNNRTPLHEAVAPGDAAMVELLLLYGANINHRNVWGATPLHMAARMGASDVVEVLLRANADSQAIDNDGRTPEDEATQREHYSGDRVFESSALKVSALSNVRDLNKLKKPPSGSV